MGHVIVVGSINRDHLIRVEHAPAPGETILADGMRRQPGGKGANQAVAAARLGARVSMVGGVGDDPDGAELVAALAAEGVDTAAVVVTDEPTGLALVTVQADGENSITVVPGANFALDPDRVADTVARLAGAGDVVVVQAELSPATMAAAVRAAASVSARCVLNLAPYRPVDDDVLAACDPIVVNESEAASLTGVRSADAAAMVTAVRRSAPSAVVTLGARGAAWSDTVGQGVVPAAPVDRVVDTTGAGDAFVGALAAAIADGATLREATELGVRAGSFAVGAPGAQSSYARTADLA